MRYLYTLSILIFLWGCEAQRLNRLCEEGPANTIAYSDLGLTELAGPNCWSVMGTFSTGVVEGGPDRNHWLIGNQAAYDTLNSRIQAEWQHQRENVLGAPVCDSIELPPIDFSQNSLLHIRMTTTGCEQKEKRIEIVRCDETQTYQVLLKWPYKGGCEPLVIAREWLLIPPLEPGYTLEIQDHTP